MPKTIPASLAALAALGLGVAALAQPPHHFHEAVRPPMHLHPTRSEALGSGCDFFTSTNAGLAWSSGNNTGATTGVDQDGILPPFQVLGNGSLVAGFEPVNAGEGAINFPTGDVSNGTQAGDQWIPLCNLDEVLDKNGVPHFVCLALLASDWLNNTIGPTQPILHSAIVHYVLPPGSTTPVLVNVIAAHSSSEGNPGFEDKPWTAYNPTTDTLYVSWTHFNPAGTLSTIEVSRLPDASSLISSNASTLWNGPVHVDQTEQTQGSNMAVDASGNLFIQWQDVDGGGNNDINTSKSTDDGQTFSAPFPTIDPPGGQTFAGRIASDGRIRIGPFPEGSDQIGLRQNQFPMLAIDTSNDAGSGQLVTVFQQANPDNINTETVDGFEVQSDFDIFLGRADPKTLQLVGPGGGGSLVRVNQNNPNDFTDQFEPSVTVSSVDGSVHVLFLDRSQDPGSFSRATQVLNGNVKVGAAVSISTDGGLTWTETHLSSPTQNPVEMPGDPTLAQENQGDPLLGDYISLRSAASAAGTVVVGAFNVVDEVNTSNVDPVSVSYTFNGSTPTMTTTNMQYHNGVALHPGTSSEMSLAVAPGGQNVVAAANDFDDVNVALLSPTPTPGGGSTTPVNEGILPGGDVAGLPAGNGGGGGGGGCFVATAAYGSYLDPHVVSLRRYRDDVLEQYCWGQAFVHWYYHWSPQAAADIAQRPVVRGVVRLGLTPVVAAVEHPWAMLIWLGASWVWVRRRRHA